MGILKKKNTEIADDSKDAKPAAPTLARRKMNQNSTIRSGRTIGERRERLETRNERVAARKRDKKKAIRRIVFTIVGFIILGGILIYLCFFLFNNSKQPDPDLTSPAGTEETGNDAGNTEYHPTVEIIDEDATTAGGKITARMNTYIGQAEQDFRDLGYSPVKAVIPSGAIREVDFYLNGFSGFIKTTIDRDSAITVEDADRMIRYLKDQGISDFQYIDVRIDKRAYWK